MEQTNERSTTSLICFYRYLKEAVSSIAAQPVDIFSFRSCVLNGHVPITDLLCTNSQLMNRCS